VVRKSMGRQWHLAKISVYMDRANVEVQARAFEDFLVCSACYQQRSSELWAKWRHCQPKFERHLGNV